MDVSQVLADLQRRKKEAAARQDFEEAQSILERIREINRSHQQTTAPAPVPSGSNTVSSASHAPRHTSRPEVVTAVGTSRGAETRVESGRMYSRVVGENFEPATATRHDHPQPQSRFPTPTTISAEPVHQHMQTPMQLHPAVNPPTHQFLPTYTAPTHANYPELGTVAPATAASHGQVQLVYIVPSSLLHQHIRMIRSIALNIPAHSICHSSSLSKSVKKSYSDACWYPWNYDSRCSPRNCPSSS